MDLELSSDQELVRDTTTRFLDDTCPLTVVRELEENADGFDQGWWRQAAELGWMSLLAPADLGGGGVSDEPLRDLALAAYERGRLVSPGPFVPTNVVLAALAASATRTDAQDELAGRLMAGEAVGALAAEELDRDWGTAVATTARRDGDDIVIDGSKVPVEAAVQAEVLAVTATLDGDPALILVPADAAGVTIGQRNTVDLVRRYGSVSLDGARVPSTEVVASGAEAVERLLDLATVLQLAETVGAIERVFEITVEWGFDRYSFGRALVTYQELKHRYADMKLWLEASKATTIAAIRALDAGAENASELVSVAASYVGEHAAELVQDCVQLHGGIGVTWDHDLHLYLRRVTLNSATYGTVGDHRRRLATLDLQGA